MPILCRKGLYPVSPNILFEKNWTVIGFSFNFVFTNEFVKLKTMLLFLGIITPLLSINSCSILVFISLSILSLLLFIRAYLHILSDKEPLGFFSRIDMFLYVNPKAILD